MKTSLLTTLSLLMIGSLAGCAAEQAMEESAESDAAELVSGPGLSLVGADDAALSVTLKLADGAQASTQNKRFIRATVARGTESFGMWCTGAGQIGAKGELQKIECGDYAATVSHDDDESFSMTFVKTDDGYEIESVDYFGDGTIYGDRMAMLEPGWAWHGGAPDPLEHIGLEAKSGEATSSDPFPFIAKVGARL